MRTAITLSIGLAAALLAGCRATPARSTPLTKHEAVGIATAAALHQGADLRRYKAPRVRYDSGERRWYIEFDQKPPAAVDGDIIIEVDDETGSGTLKPSG